MFSCVFNTLKRINTFKEDLTYIPEKTTMVKFWYVSALFVLNVTQFVLLSAQACSEKGWFGSNCQYQCNCHDENCDFTSGECGIRSYCDKGWFGPACQFVDLTTTESNSTSPAWLYDGDDTTCNENESLDKVTVELEKPFPVTWLRLYINDLGDQTSIQVQFKGDLSSEYDDMVDCNNKRTAILDDKSLDIHCDQDILVQQVILTGKGVKSLCSVYISGGRQVTLRQPTTQSSPAFASNSFMGVDGQKSPESDDCTSTSNGDTNPSWNVTFQEPKAINRFLLTYKQNEYITHVLTCYDNESTQLFKSERYDESTAVTYHTATVRPVEPVSVINVKVYSAPPFYKPLILCELLAYGDTVCPQGKYGRECEHNCDNCLNQTCFVATGECPLGCVDGFLGGWCQTQCQPRNYGPNCELSCSTNCTDQHCHPVHGSCLKCPPGYSGDGCDTPCESDTYGQDCAQKCNPRCVRDETLASSVCDHINGTCLLDCIDGKCETPDEDGSGLSVGAIAGIAVGALAFIIIIIICVWCCCCRHSPFYY